MDKHEALPNPVELELEKKFEINEIPEVIDVSQAAEIDQGYITIRGGVEVRVRASTANGETKHVITRKVGQGEKREERERNISAEAFRDIWPLTTYRRIQKTRIRYPVGKNLTAELDFYKGDHSGLRLAEVEFEDEGQMNEFEPPDWFGERVHYSNSQLALMGLTDFETKDVASVPELPLDEGLKSLISYIDSLEKVMDRPVIVSVAGGSASGKTSAVADKLQDYFGLDALTITLDNYYTPEAHELSKQTNGEQINLDSPDMVDLALAAGHLAQLKAGRTVDMPLYSFKDGRSGIKPISPQGKQVIIVEGLFALNPEIAQESDVTTFVSAEIHGRMMRRLFRDVDRTNWNPNKILSYYTILNEMHDQFVEPTRHQADVIIGNNYDPGEEAEKTGAKEYQVKYEIKRGDDQLNEEALRKLGAEILSSDIEQEDTYYDLNEQSISDTNEVVRIRRSDDSLTFSYKGPILTNVDFRIRPKIEFPIDEDGYSAITKIYPNPIKTVSKSRTTFLIDGVIATIDSGVTITNDQTSRYLGRFIELRTNEDDQDKLRAVAVKLGLSENPITTQYFSM